MPQSLARVHIHLVFSTKNREPLINDTIRDPLHRYIAVILQNFGSPADLINSIEDHVHILFDLGRTASISQVVEEIKTAETCIVILYRSTTNGSPRARSYGFRNVGRKQAGT